MKYRVGLDIGVASVGWSVLETDDLGNPIRIADLGVRIFDAAEHPKDGSSLALPRRRARGLRRLIRRRAHRVERVKSLLEKRFGAGIVEKIEKNDRLDIIKTRVKGLDEKLSLEELGRVCLYFVKHRGFKSSRKAGSKEEDEGKLLSATKENEKRLNDGAYRTVGEMIYLDAKYSRDYKGEKVYKYRNNRDKYENTFLRSNIEREISTLLTKQKEVGLVDQDFIDKYLEIFRSQRGFDEGPGEGSPYSGTFAVGLCSFEREKGYERAPKAAYTFEYSIALQRLNNLTVSKNGKKTPLTKEQRESVLEMIRTKKTITYTELRKVLGYLNDEESRFNLLTYSNKKTVKEIEKAKFVSMEKSYAIRKSLDENTDKSAERLDVIAEIISKYKSIDRQREEFIKAGLGLSEAEMKKISEIDATKFGHLSLFALRKIQPYLVEGAVYSDACEKAGYNHSQKETNKLKYLKGDEIIEIINEITSPVVRRSFSQTLKVINAIVLKYGSPIGVNVEVARDLSKPLEERRQIQKEMEDRHKENERIMERLKSEFGLLSPKGMDIIKFRLWEEQGNKCAYSGKTIEPDRLFENNYAQIDHIIPYSRGFDDSYANKVLVLSEENQRKRNRTPYEYFGKDDQERWEFFTALVDTFNCSWRKKQNLLRKNFGEDEEKEWKERNLNDTRYASRLVHNIIKDYLQFDDSIPDKVKVRAVSGAITAYVRKMWGLSKIREEGDKHHALDATVIATVTPALIQRITRYNQAKERLFYRARDGYFVDADGVVLTRDAFDEVYGEKLAPPYDHFVNELGIRLLEEVEEQDEYGKVRKGIREVQLQRLAEMGYTEEQIKEVEPLFVSRMPKRKAKGALHKETVYSAKYYNEENDYVLVVRKPLTDLTYDKKTDAIVGYFELAKQSDPILYNALKERLKEFDGDAKKAFKEPFYKPKKNGERGPLVETVKIQTRNFGGMMLDEVKGYVQNEVMVRVDVFTKDDKYFCVPVYAKDIAIGKIPNQAITAGKKPGEWQEMTSDYQFLYALYPNDLVFVKSKKPFNMKNKRTNDEIHISEGYLYYKGIDISNGKARFITHDNGYETGLGVKTLLQMKKYTVDILGNKVEVKKEKREVEGISKKK